jgi:hypothetical protein
MEHVCNEMERVCNKKEHVCKEMERVCNERADASDTLSGKETFSSLVSKNSSTSAEETAAAFDTALGYCC